MRLVRQQVRATASSLWEYAGGRLAAERSVTSAEENWGVPGERSANTEVIALRRDFGGSIADKVFGFEGVSCSCGSRRLADPWQSSLAAKE